MAETRVGFEGVFKKFRRGERHDSLRDLVPATLRRLLGRAPDQGLGGEEFWALRDVSFAVRGGEALGIIGPNGAGKSTALKLLTRILRPTRGNCWVRGRVGALIEIAAGFHPDLTGRENLFLQGAIMGLRHVEIEQRLEEIVEFAGVRSFLDTPVKRYSSGMSARLGFAIAAHLSPQVLIIDEVLSVGDMAFQHKCVERMLEFKRAGVAIVFVSHNLEAIGRLCDRAVLLNGGEMAACGPVAEVVSAYLNSHGLGVPSGGALIEMTSSELVAEDGNRVSAVTPGTRLELTATYRVCDDFSDVTFGFRISRSTDNLLVYEGVFTDGELGIALKKGRSFRVSFRFLAHLARGHYHIVCYAKQNAAEKLLGRLSPAASFRVEEARSRGGVASVELSMHVAEIRTSQPVALS